MSNATLNKHEAPTPRLKRLLGLLSDHSIEIVSYGLAPNPWGFCYEAPAETPNYIHNQVNQMLDSLNSAETEVLRREVFG